MYTKQGAQSVTYRAPKYNLPSFLTDQPGQLSLFFESFFFRSAQKHNLNLEEDVKILLPIKCHGTTSNCSSGIIENVSANHLPCYVVSLTLSQ